MHRLSLLIIVIGVFCGPLTYAEDEVSDDGGSIHKGMVLVEPTNIIATSVEGVYRLKPYKERRPRWGSTLSVDYSTYEPIHYEPNFAPPGEFKDVYSTPDVPMIDLSFSVKRNLSFGSVGGELGVGIYKNDSDDISLSDSTLTLTPVRIGGVVFLDTLSPEPYIVPYASGGGYIMIYKEQLAGTSKNGTTQIAPYVNGGVEFSLDWMDRKNARVAYESSGIESSYFMLEVRKMMASGAEKDPDFSDDVSFAAGLRVEF